jgi:hypothetical protein
VGTKDWLIESIKALLNMLYINTSLARIAIWPGGGAGSAWAGRDTAFPQPIRSSYSYTMTPANIWITKHFSYWLVGRQHPDIEIKKLSN